VHTAYSLHQLPQPRPDPFLVSFSTPIPIPPFPRLGPAGRVEQLEEPLAVLRHNLDGLLLRGPSAGDLDTSNSIGQS
jgi:hypothetical protein